MSRQFRYRVTAIVVGGLIFGAPMLANGMASADQVIEQGAHQVTFQGGTMFGLSCRSRPDVESMTVPADTTVRLVNRTGYSARLELGGDPKGTLADDSATDVIFRRGTTSVSLKPNCPLGDDASPVMVTAAPSASGAMPDPIPAPTSGSTDAVTIAPSGSDSREPSSSGAADSDSPAQRPSRAGHAGSQRPGTPRTSATVTDSRAAGEDEPQTKTKARTPLRTPGEVAPAFAGMPPGDQKALVPAVPELDVPPAPQDAVPAAEPSPTTEIAVAEPVAAMAPMRDGRPIGMLALAAAVCVLGVGAAAIRAIVSQRANRAKMA